MAGECYVKIRKMVKLASSPSPVAQPIWDETSKGTLMMSNKLESGCSARRLITVLGLAILAMAFVFGAAACSADDVGGTGTVSCDRDTDCPLGTVCSASNVCIEASCDYCLEDQICYVTPENPSGTCSAPECYGPQDCPDGLPCVAGVCGGSSTNGTTNNGSGCNSHSDCNQAAGEICNIAGQCVAGEGGDSCSSNSDCDTSTDFCDPATGQCTPAQSCANVECGPGEVCVEPHATCNPDCTQSPQGCDEGDYCDASTGNCVANTCSTLDPADCTGATPIFDGTSCECISCLGSSDCPAGHQCQGGSCVQATGCETACSSSTPGVCGGNTPYCIDNCCVECLGAADCPSGQMCVDGHCGTPPGCTTSSDCPSGYSCDGGSCVPPQTGQACTDPDDCPEGTFCDTTTGQCQSPGGELGCGFCNDDCTCPGDMECMGFVCAGCEFSVGWDGISDNCPDGQSCMPLFQMCFPD